MRKLTPYPCSTEGCEKPGAVRGLCRSCYTKMLTAAGRIKNKTTPKKNAEATLKKGGVLHPPKSLPYRVLARTCPTCGNLNTTPDDLLRKDSGKRLPKCPRCAVWWVMRNQRNRKNADPEYAQKQRDRTECARRRKQAELFISATNSRKEWTGPELEMVERRDLSAAQVAAMLGRSLYSVKHKRAAIRRDDPRTMQLLGGDRL